MKIFYFKCIHFSVVPKSFKCTNYNQGYALPCDGEQLWIYLDYVYCSCDWWRSADVSWHLCISYQSYLLSSICWMPGLGWCGAGRGRAGLVCIDWVLGPETRGAEDWWQIRVRHMHPTITPAHRRFCHLVIVSTFSSITKQFKMCCEQYWLVCGEQ